MLMTPTLRRIIFDRFEFKGLHGCRSCCALLIQRLRDGRTLIVASELPDNPGTSITNAVDLLASMIASQLALDPRQVVWIEHYPPGRTHGPHENWDRVTFDFIVHDGVNTVFGEPKWQPMRPIDWRCLGLDHTALFLNQ